MLENIKKLKLVPLALQFFIAFFWAFSSLAGADSTKGTTKQTPFLGVSYYVIDTQQFKQSAGFGYYIMRVIKDSVADVIGLEDGDIIIGFDDQDLSAIASEKRQQFLSGIIRAKEVGDIFNVKVLRQETMITQGSTTLDNIEVLKQTIDNQAAPSQFNFSINKRILSLEFSAKLGSRATIDELDLPDNGTLYPAYQNLKTSWTSLIEKTIHQYNLEDDYQDLLNRYKKNELWDDGFRLNLFRYIHRDPIKLTPVIDKRSNDLAQQLSTKPSDVVVFLSDWIDTAIVATHLIYPTSDNIAIHQGFITQVLNNAKGYKDLAFASLTMAEVDYIKAELPKLIERFSQSFYIDRFKHKADKKHNTRLIELSKKVDFKALFTSGQLLMTLANTHWLNHLKQLLNRQSIRFDTKVGKVSLGGWGNSDYSQAYALIIDTFGDDIYRASSGITSDGIGMVIDLSGNDTYQHTRPYSQGSAFLGVNILFDLLGDDTYIANTHTQGFALLGVGLLIDVLGDDRYLSKQFSQGVAFWGLGGLLDLAGNDVYRANLYAQGVGGVGAMGILFDKEGNDYYFATGSEESSYGVSGIFKGNAQGVGIGFRGYASGGIGLLLDNRGRDKFRAGNFSQGVGYFYGLGILKNGGNADDIYLSSRYSQGASAHSAIGILIDDGGNDHYQSLSGVSQSAAWDIALASLWDKSGNDTYIGSNAFSSHNGFSVFIDEQGYDTYARISGGEINDYHGGVSFGFFIDGAGLDIYPQGYGDNTQKYSKKYGIFSDL